MWTFRTQRNICTIVGFKLCHFYAIYWPCTEFLALTMNCLVIILPKCHLESINCVWGLMYRFPTECKDFVFYATFIYTMPLVQKENKVLYYIILSKMVHKNNDNGS